MTNHPYKPPLVFKDVFHSSPFLILIWWLANLRSFLEKDRARQVMGYLY